MTTRILKKILVDTLVVDYQTQEWGTCGARANAFRSKFKTAHIRISLVRMQNRVKTKLNNNDIFRG